MARIDAQHVVPLNDTFEHDADGGPCPCVPSYQDDAKVVVHNSFDGREVPEVVRRALDTLALALVGHDHQWGTPEREAYEHAIALMDFHHPQEGPTVLRG